LSSMAWWNRSVRVMADRAGYRERWAAALALCLGASGCQGYEWVFQPNSDRAGTELSFRVRTPSKADLLFVIDNSGSMTEEQAALRSSISYMLEALAPQDTQYRIGITSTDAFGFVDDCAGNTNPGVGPMSDPHGARGFCSAPGVLDASRALLRPHDGTRGRLVAFYDASIFDLTAIETLRADHGDAALTAEEETALAELLPTSVSPPDDPDSHRLGARYLIDRVEMETEACNACLRARGDEEGACDHEDTCVATVASELVSAYFRANVAGLGIDGWGWEQGLKAGALAIGIDPAVPDDDVAMNPPDSLIVSGQPNTVDDASWLRDDAMLAIMFVTDEQDSSMVREAEADPHALEAPGPEGSICYQPELVASLLPVDRISDLMTARKSGQQSRVAIGVIAGLAPGDVPSEAAPSDCRSDADGTPTAVCSGWAGATAGTESEWLAYTARHEATDATCTAMAASRYRSFASAFTRRAFESVCRAGTGDGENFGPALRTFAQIATTACFDLQDVRPVGGNPELITVRRAAGADVEAGGAPELLPMSSIGATDLGWYYDDTRRQICLTGTERLIGDLYQIFILSTDEVDYGPDAHNL
jgi:hypothetical protein